MDVRRRIQIYEDMLKANADPEFTKRQSSKAAYRLQGAIQALKEAGESGCD